MLPGSTAKALCCFKTGGDDMGYYITMSDLIQILTLLCSLYQSLFNLT